MGRYIIRRLLLMVPVAFLVTVIVFTLVRLAPGDPIAVYAGEEKDPAALDALRHEFGLDQPMPVQYAAWLSHALRGDLGRSIRTRQPVLESIVERLRRAQGWRLRQPPPPRPAGDHARDREHGREHAPGAIEPPRRLRPGLHADRAGEGASRDGAPRAARAEERAHPRRDHHRATGGRDHR